MKVAAIYLFGIIGIIGIIFIIKLFSLTSIKADEIKNVEDKHKANEIKIIEPEYNTEDIKIIEDKYKDESSESILENKDDFAINLKNNKINNLESIDNIKTAAGVEADDETKLSDIGFARNYYVEPPNPTMWESIAHSIDYLKSNINIFSEDSGFYGSLGLIYTYDIYNDGRDERKQNNFKQEYSLGYRGALYSPKLLKYTLFTTIRYENIKDKVNNITNENKIESYDYEARLNFLNRTRIPFSIYAMKTQKPNTIFFENAKSESMYNNLLFGLSGQINLKMFKINYSASDSKGVYEDIFSNDNRENSMYKTTFTKETKNHNFRLSYENTNQMIDRKNVNYSSKSNIDNENVDLIYRAKISDALRLNAQSYYRMSGYTDNVWAENETQSILSNLNLSWNPKGKHSASISISGTSIKDENIKLNTNTSVDNIQISQSYGYRMTKNLNMSQSSSHSVVFTDFSTIKNTNVSSNINYTTKISEDSSLNISASASINNNSNDTNSSTYIADITSYTYSVGTGINQMLLDINSRLRIGFGYNGSMNTRNEIKDSYNANFNMDTILYSVIRNQLSVNYFNDIIDSLDYNNISIFRSTQRITINNKINYTTRIGFRGTLNSKVGIEYLLAKTTDREDIDKLMPKIDLLFKYRLGQKLRHTTKINIYKEVFYDTISYNFESDFRFSSGKLSASIEYVYNKTIVGDNINILDRDKHRVSMKFKRMF